VTTSHGPQYTQEFVTFYDHTLCQEVAIHAQEDMVKVVTRALEHAQMSIQMPCLEVTYDGSMRWGQVKQPYVSLMFCRHCRNIGGVAELLIRHYLDTPNS
jgi:predicted secreted protein